MILPALRLVVDVPDVLVPVVGVPLMPADPVPDKPPPKPEVPVVPDDPEAPGPNPCAPAVPPGVLHEREREDVGDLREDREDREANEAAVRGDNRGDRHDDAFLDVGDLRRKADGEHADSRRHAGHEGPLDAVLHRRHLAIEEGHLRGEHDVGPRVSLGGPDEEEGFDVAQDGHADLHAGVRVESAELGNADIE